MSIVDSIKKDLGGKFPGCFIYSTKDELPSCISLPDGWEDFGSCDDDKPSYPKAWAGFSTELPSVLGCLHQNLLCTLVVVGDKVEMIYAFHDANGFYYYVGGEPVKDSAEQSTWLDALPERVQDFYRKVHNGYTYLSAESMGPQKLDDQCRLSALIDEDDVAYADNWITVFSNGGGDYIAIEVPVQEGNHALIWWHEEPDNPQRGVDVFQTMDAWMAIFSEGTCPRKAVVGD